MVLQVKRSGEGIILKEGLGILRGWGAGGMEVMVFEDDSDDDDDDDDDNNDDDDDNNEYVHDDDYICCQIK